MACIWAPWGLESADYAAKLVRESGSAPCDALNADPCPRCPSSAGLGPKLLEAGPLLVKFGPTLAEIGRPGQISTAFGPNLAEAGPIVSESGPILSEFGRSRAKFWPNLGRNGRFGSRCSRPRDNAKSTLRLHGARSVSPFFLGAVCAVNDGAGPNTCMEPTTSCVAALPLAFACHGEQSEGLQDLHRMRCAAELG